MSIAEKLTLIAENEQRVYNAGYEKGKAEGGGECYRPHVIKVDELPVENIDESAVYKVTEPRFDDVIMVSSGVDVSLARYGYISELYYVTTRPTENIKVSNDEKIYAYYVEDQDSIFVYGTFASIGVTSDSWVYIGMLLDGRYNGSFTYRGIVSREDEATEDGCYYALMGEDYRYAEYVGGEWVFSDANAVVRVNELEEQFAASFPADKWVDGEYTDYINGSATTVRYKYRKGRTDPKDIDITDENGIERSIRDIDGNSYLATTLVEYYFYSLLCKCGRLWVEYGSALARALYEDPVVITYVDLSNYVADSFGITFNCVAHAMQASLKNYDGDGDAVNNDTVVSYFVESDLEDVVDESEAQARLGYILFEKFGHRWVYEHYDNGSGGSYAYGGTCAAAYEYFTWE